MNRWFLIAALAVLISVAVAKPKCGKCDLNACKKPPKQCPAGIVKDPCGCCDVCGNLEGEYCDHPDVKLPHSVGNCGHKLDCKLRKDVGDKEEAVCVCASQEELCGSDGNTYSSICKLMEKVVVSDKKISIKSKGPCKQAPKIISRPEHQFNKTGADIALACEAAAYPIPTIEWTWTKVGGKANYLPSDDEHISVNVRGGPERHSVTGWLLIQRSQKYHEGDYTCVAQNEHGVDQATARVKLTGV